MRGKGESMGASEVWGALRGQRGQVGLRVMRIVGYEGQVGK